MEDQRSTAVKLDEEDELRTYRSKFHFPTTHDDIVYLNGNSLGLQPKVVEKYIDKELADWKNYGVEGHFMGDTPWISYHEPLAKPLSSILGSNTDEVIIMNTLTVNLHLMMVSFYQPTPDRYKVLVEYSPFPSDIYAIKSQIDYHGFDPDDALIELKPDKGELVSNERILSTIEEHKNDLALVLIGGVNYYTGQTYDMEYITKIAHSYDIKVGFDLAHAVGNIKLQLHDWNVDFAVFCTYKYLNSGPGSIGGAFIHRKFHDEELPRFAGWWGHDKETRFLMDDTFVPIQSAEGWQLSNPPILSLAAIKASLDVFEKAKMEKLIEKRNNLVNFARKLLLRLDKYIEIITPDEDLSGAQLSIKIHENAKKIHEELNKNGIICDWREPSVIRVAFAPLYNSFLDVFKFVMALDDLFREYS